MSDIFNKKSGKPTPTANAVPPGDSIGKSCLQFFFTYIITWILSNVLLILTFTFARHLAIELGSLPSNLASLNGGAVLFFIFCLGLYLGSGMILKRFKNQWRYVRLTICLFPLWQFALPPLTYVCLAWLRH